MFIILTSLASLFGVWGILAIYWLAPDMFLDMFVYFDVSDIGFGLIVIFLSLIIAKRNIAAQ